MTISLAGGPLLAVLLSSLRIVAWLVLVPPFSSRAVPVAARVILALALSFAVAPAMAGRDLPTGAVALLVTAATEVAVGAGMGFLTYLLFAAVATAGSLIDVFGGLALAQGFDPIAMRPSTVFGQFHEFLAAMLLFATGGQLVVIGGLLETFDLLPLGATPTLGSASQVLTTAFEMFLVTAVQIALPMIAVLFVADLGMALLTKVAPALNALSVIFPAKIGLTLLLVGLSFPALPGAVTRLAQLANEASAALVGAR